MKPQIDSLEYQRLELITNERSCQLSWRLQLKKLWDWLLEYFTNSSKLRVWHTCDRQGKIWWSAYEPSTKQFINRVSEEQIRIWIERRYY